VMSEAKALAEIATVKTAEIRFLEKFTSTP